MYNSHGKTIEQLENEYDNLIQEINNTKIYFNQTEIEGTTLTQKGEYTIVAQLYARDIPDLGTNPVITSDRLTVTWVVNAVDADALERVLTIASVTQRLLDAGVTRRTSQAVKYTLNEAFVEKSYTR